jgi:hypothetical protein
MAAGVDVMVKAGHCPQFCRKAAGSLPANLQNPPWGGIGVHNYFQTTTSHIYFSPESVSFAGMEHIFGE